MKQSSHKTELPSFKELTFYLAARPLPQSPAGRSNLSNKKQRLRPEPGTPLASPRPRTGTPQAESGRGRGPAGLGGPETWGGSARRFGPGEARIPPDRGRPRPMWQVTDLLLFQRGGDQHLLPELGARGPGLGLNSSAVSGCRLSQSGPEKAAQRRPGRGSGSGRGGTSPRATGAGVARRARAPSAGWNGPVVAASGRRGAVSWCLGEKGNSPLTKLPLSVRGLKALTATWSLLESFCCLWRYCERARPHLIISSASLHSLHLCIMMLAPLYSFHLKALPLLTFWGKSRNEIWLKILSHQCLGLY